MTNDNSKHFEILNSIDVSDKIEKKKSSSGELSYLSWAWAYGELKKKYPSVIYEVQKFNGLPYVFDPLTGYMVYTKITVENITHEMWLPVMDGANKAMKDKPYEYTTKFGKKTCEAATMFDINKTIMRCFVKNIAMFGLGLYIFAGEDLPEDSDDKINNKVSNKNVTKSVATSLQDFEVIKRKLIDAIDIKLLDKGYEYIMKHKISYTNGQLLELNNIIEAKRNELTKE
jgi:hypothetical protein